MTETALASGDVEHFLSRSYAAVPASCGSARADVAAFLSTAGADTEAVDVALLAASELVTNGLVHHEVRAGEQLCVDVQVMPGPGGAWIRLTVVDGGPGRLRMPTGLDDGGERGRGLLLLRGLGVIVRDAPPIHPQGYEVSAIFPADGVARRRVCGCGCTRSTPDSPSQCLLLVPDSPDTEVMDSAYGVLSRAVCDPCRAHTPLRAGSPTPIDHNVTYIGVGA